MLPEIICFSFGLTIAVTACVDAMTCSHIMCTPCTHTYTGEGIYVTQFGLICSWKVKHSPCTLLASTQDCIISEWGSANEQIR